MSEGGAYGDRLATRFRIAAAPSFVARTLRDNAIAVTEIKCDIENNGLTEPIPREDALLVTLQLKFCPAHDLWIDSKPAKTAPLPAGAVSIYDHRAKPIANSISTFHNLHFYFPRAALDAINEAEGSQRSGEFAHNPGEGFHDPIIQGLGRSLLPAFERPDEANTLFVDYVTTATAAYVARLLGGGGLVPIAPRALSADQLGRVREMIRASLPGELRIATLASECGMTPDAAFRRTADVAPHERLLKCRVPLAMDLVRRGQITLEDVATMCGFASEAHLIRVFHRTMGRRDSPIEAQLGQVKAGDKRVDHADEGLRRDIVIDAGWQQADLISAIAVDEAHSPPPSAFNGLIL
jgi:AraC family transcriptional regulator